GETPPGRRPAGRGGAAGGEPRPFSPADLHVLDHGVQLAATDRRPHLGRRIEAVADPERLRPRPDLFEERLVAALVHDDPAGRGAALAAGPEAAPQAAFHRQLE